MSSFCADVVAVLVQHFGPGDATAASTRAQEFAMRLVDVILEAEEGSIDVFKEEFVDMDDDAVDPNWSDSDTDEEMPFDDSFMSPSDPTKVRVAKDCWVDRDVVDTAIKWYKNNKKEYRPISSMSARFRWIKGAAQMNVLWKIMKRDEDQLSRREALKELKDKLYEWAVSKFEAGVSLHDADLRYQALRICRENSYLDKFKASPSWILRFKRDHRLCSRRVTKFVSKKKFVDRNKIDAEAEAFVKEVKDLITSENIPLDCVFNADQSGFVKEMHGARSLSLKGVKSVFRVVSSESATKHSFTVLPMISPDGSHRNKLFVVLQEPGGKFPAKGHYSADNLAIFAHSSHIMTKALMFKWFEECVFTRDMPDVMLLIVDSWTSFKDHEQIQKLVPHGKKLFIRNIPGGATSKIQPLDVFYFNVMKRFMKRITSFVQVHGIDFKVHQRDNLLKTISLIFWQFNHPDFADFVKYAWHSAGYIDRPPKFEHPVQKCFGGKLSINCEEPGCNNFSFIRCAYCSLCLCFNDFIVNDHRCC